MAVHLTLRGKLMPKPVTNAVCRCGRPFICGAATGHCWCFDLPKVVPIPGAAEGGGCLCPNCLAEQVAAAAAKPPASAGPLQPSH